VRNYVFTLLFLASSFTLAAQNAPKIEVFGGFSYLNYEAVSVNLPSGTQTITDSCTISSSGSTCIATTVNSSTVNFNRRMGLYGWNGSVTAILTPWFGITTDVSGNYSTSSQSITSSETIIETPICSPYPCSPITTTTTYQYSVSEPILHHFLFGPQFSFPTRRIRFLPFHS